MFSRAIETPSLVINQLFTLPGVPERYQNLTI